ncbi:Protein of unknown function [Gryllus bimaculatus]|nr:Protein of unknown function [Gryllus bimaculatus]
MLEQSLLPSHKTQLSIVRTAKGLVGDWFTITNTSDRRRPDSGTCWSSGTPVSSILLFRESKVVILMLSKNAKIDKESLKMSNFKHYWMWMMHNHKK